MQRSPVYLSTHTPNNQKPSSTLSNLTAGRNLTAAKSVLCPTNVRISEILYLRGMESVSLGPGRVLRQRCKTHLIIVGLSRLIPQPSTRTPLGRPIDSSISGRNIPDWISCQLTLTGDEMRRTLAISIHLFKPSCHENTSILGWKVGDELLSMPSSDSKLTSV